jgi:phosphoribosylaminoimidazolecarboxamide formyltransferase/IMP cyclohydrolase
LGKVRRALISVTNKDGVAAFAAGLARLGIEILSTGGTARALREAGVSVTDVAAYTGSPEILGGRVKTLHPRIHGGILARRANPQDRRELEANHIPTIDLVAVNLYAFEKAAEKGLPLAEAVEEIDIGGPTLLRAAAKGFEDVTVVSDPADYPRVLAQIEAAGETSRELRFELARKVFRLTSAYDAAIAAYLDRLAEGLGLKERG